MLEWPGLRALPPLPTGRAQGAKAGEGDCHAHGRSVTNSWGMSPRGRHGAQETRTLPGHKSSGAPWCAVDEDASSCWGEAESGRLSVPNELLALCLSSSLESRHVPEARLARSSSINLRAYKWPKMPYMRHI